MPDVPGVDVSLVRGLDVGLMEEEAERRRLPAPSTPGKHLRLTGERFLRGRGGFIGDPREGVIVLPVPALEDRYRRCPPPDHAAELPRRQGRLHLLEKKGPPT